MTHYYTLQYGYHLDTNDRIHIDDTLHEMKNKISCEICNTGLIFRKGSIKIHHFAHKSGERNCDSFKINPLTEWHRKWQNYFKEHNYGTLEFVIKRDEQKHRTDIYTNTKYCVEIQHSNISHEDISKRETFYGERMLWIVDGLNTNFTFLFKTKNDYYIGKFNKSYIESCKKTIYIDTDYGLFEIIKYIRDKICIVKPIDKKLIAQSKILKRCFRKNQRSLIYDELYKYMNYSNISELQNIHYCKEYNLEQNMFIDSKYIFDKYLKKLGYVQYLNNSYCESLENVIVQTDEICIEAIRQDYNNYEYVRNKSDEFNLKAVSQCGLVLKFIKESLQTEELCVKAIKQNYSAINFVLIKSKLVDEIKLSYIDAEKYKKFKQNELEL